MKKVVAFLCLVSVFALVACSDNTVVCGDDCPCKAVIVPEYSSKVQIIVLSDDFTAVKQIYYGNIDDTVNVVLKPVDAVVGSYHRYWCFYYSNGLTTSVDNEAVLIAAELVIPFTFTQAEHTLILMPYLWGDV